MNLPEMPEIPEPEMLAGLHCEWVARKREMQAYASAYGKLCLELGYKMGREDAAKVDLARQQEEGLKQPRNPLMPPNAAKFGRY